MSFRTYARLGAVLLGLAFVLSVAPATVSAAVNRPSLSLVSIAVLTGVNGSSATGNCALLVSASRGKARLHCSVKGDGH